MVFLLSDFSLNDILNVTATIIRAVNRSGSEFKMPHLYLNYFNYEQNTSHFVNVYCKMHVNFYDDGTSLHTSSL